MPSLHWLGRRWWFASDDLFVPFSYLVVCRVGGIAVLPIAWCDELSPSLHLACWSVLGANLAGIVLESLVVAVSTQGAIVDCAARDRRVRPLLTGHLVLHLAELCLAVAVQTHVDYDAPGCEKGALLLRLLLLAYLGLLVAMLTALPALSSTVRFSRWVKALCCFVRLDETAEQVIVHCLTTVRR